MSCGHPHDCNVDRERKMVTLATDETGRARVFCDPCIAGLVGALNAGGVQTIASCCGHGRRPGTIVLADGRVLIVAPNLAKARAIESAGAVAATINDPLPATETAHG